MLDFVVVLLGHMWILLCGIDHSKKHETIRISSLYG